jgi:hypothetical protein
MFHGPVHPQGQDPAIHPAWCGCSDCQFDVRRRGFRADLLVIALGAAAALAMLAVHWLGLV